MTSSGVVMAYHLLPALTKALDLDLDHVRRIVLDVEAGKPVIAYVEQFGDDKLLKLDWAGELKDTEIKFSEKKP